MSGRCYACATGFSVFKKELGCKNCGFAFCKNCLQNKAPVPRHNNEKHKVCLKCFNILTGKTKPKDPTPPSPPEALKKRLAALDDPSVAKPLPSHTAPAPRAPGHADKYKGMDRKDRDIAERLNKLKEDRQKDPKTVPSTKEMEQRLAQLKDKPPAPSASEMSERLAKLKGQDPAAANKPHVFPVDRRLQGQQVDDLLEEICAEVEIDNKHIDPARDVQARLDNYKGKEPSPASVPRAGVTLPRGEGESEESWAAMQRMVEEVADELALDAHKAVQGLQDDKEIWSRLQELRKKDKKGDTATDTEGAAAMNTEENNRTASDEEEDDEAAKILIRKLLIENELDEKSGMSSFTATESNGDDSSGKTGEDDDEFPWCIICNEDATLRCRGCDDDLYCARCFREGHDRFDLEDHTTVPFKPKKSKS